MPIGENSLCSLKCASGAPGGGGLEMGIGDLSDLHPLWLFSFFVPKSCFLKIKVGTPSPCFPTTKHSLVGYGLGAPPCHQLLSFPRHQCRLSPSRGDGDIWPYWSISSASAPTVSVALCCHYSSTSEPASQSSSSVFLSIMVASPASILGLLFFFHTSSWVISSLLQFQPLTKWSSASDLYLGNSLSWSCE